MKKRILSAIITGALAITGTSAYSVSYTSAEAAVSSDFTYKYTPDGTGINITGYTGTSTELIIPDTIEGLPVKLINTNAFKDNVTITSAKLPDTVEAIGSDAFGGCKNLKTVNMPSALASIYNYAFTTCHSLESVTFGDNVTSIGECAFQLCISLTEISVPGTVKTIADHAFHGCSSVERIIFEEGVEVIEADAMLNAYSIERIYFPSTVKEIGEHAVGYTYFSGTYSLQTDAIIFGYMGTAAESYAEACGFSFKPYNLGDLDSNGAVTAVDAALVLREYAETAVNGAPSFNETEKTLADVTFDGTITATDASRILSCYAYNAAGGDVLSCDYFYDLVNN